MPIPADTMGEINVATSEVTPPTEREDVIRRLFWTPRDDLNSLILFLGEFKKLPGLRNRNQLL
jgi:hypothetical protein